MDVLKEFDIEKDIVQVLQTRRLTYFGHVNRMQTERYVRVLLHGYTRGHRPNGRPKKKWIDNIRENCSDMDISLHEASRLTSDRTSARLTSTGFTSCGVSDHLTTHQQQRSCTLL